MTSAINSDLVNKVSSGYLESLERSYNKPHTEAKKEINAPTAPDYVIERFCDDEN
jgi:hypothetical protein